MQIYKSPASRGFTLISPNTQPWKFIPLSEIRSISGFMIKGFKFQALPSLKGRILQKLRNHSSF